MTDSSEQGSSNICIYVAFLHTIEHDHVFIQAAWWYVPFLDLLLKHWPLSLCDLQIQKK